MAVVRKEENIGRQVGSEDEVVLRVPGEGKVLGLCKPRNKRCKSREKVSKVPHTTNENKRGRTAVKFGPSRFLESASRQQSWKELD